MSIVIYVSIVKITFVKYTIAIICTILKTFTKADTTGAGCVVVVIFRCELCTSVRHVEDNGKDI